MGGPGCPSLPHATRTSGVTAPARVCMASARTEGTAIMSSWLDVQTRASPALAPTGSPGPMTRCSGSQFSHLSNGYVKNQLRALVSIENAQSPRLTHTCHTRARTPAGAGTRLPRAPKLLQEGSCPVPLVSDEILLRSWHRPRPGSGPLGCTCLPRRTPAQSSRSQLHPPTRHPFLSPGSSHLPSPVTPTEGLFSTLRPEGA